MRSQERNDLKPKFSSGSALQENKGDTLTDINSMILQHFQFQQLSNFKEKKKYGGVESEDIFLYGM